MHAMSMPVSIIHAPTTVTSSLTVIGEPSRREQLAASTSRMSFYASAKTNEPALSLAAAVATGSGASNAENTDAANNRLLSYAYRCTTLFFFSPFPLVHNHVQEARSGHVRQLAAQSAPRRVHVDVWEPSAWVLLLFFFIYRTNTEFSPVRSSDKLVRLDFKAGSMSLAVADADELLRSFS